MCNTYLPFSTQNVDWGSTRALMESASWRSGYVIATQTAQTEVTRRIAVS